MRLLQLKLLSADAAAGAFTGLAATFGPLPDRVGDVIEPGAFDATLTAWKARGGSIPLLWQHDQSKPIGTIAGAMATGEGLQVTGQLVLDTEHGAEAYALAKAGALSMSIGYTIPPGGLELVGDVRYLLAVDLHEVSLVSVPANADARITAVKSARQCQSIREFEALARDALGLSNRDAKAVASKAWPVLQRDAAGRLRDGWLDDQTAREAVAILRRSSPSLR